MRRVDPELAKAFIEAEHQVQEENDKIEAIKDENNSCDSQEDEAKAENPETGK